MDTGAFLFVRHRFPASRSRLFTAAENRRIIPPKNKERKRTMNAKPVTTLVIVLLAVISLAQLLRLVFQVEIIVAGLYVPVWLSIFGFIIPAVLALLLWRENRK